MGERRVRRVMALLSAALASGGLATLVAAGPASAQTSAPAPAHGTTPAVVVKGAQTFVVYRAANDSVWMKDTTTGQTTSVGGRLLSAPSVISSGPGEEIFGRGTDNQLWENYCNIFGGCGSPWLPLGGRITAKPGAVLRGSGGYSVYVRGTDGAVWARDHDSSGWDAWHRVGGQLLAGTGPTAAAIGDSTYVMVVGTNQELYLEEVGVTGFGPIGGRTTANPALTAIPGNTLVGFARGTNDVGYYHQFRSYTPGWHPMGGVLSSGVGAATLSGQLKTYTVGLGTNGQVYLDQGYWTTYPPLYSGWTKVTG